MGTTCHRLLVLAFALLAAPAQAASVPAGSTVLLSGTPDLLATLPAPANHSGAPPGTTSDDGRIVAFVSRSDGLSDLDDDRVTNVYVKDVLSGAVTLANRRTDGGPAGASCRDPALSGDGSTVAFTCDGPLVPEDTNGEQDVYVRRLTGAGTTILVSRSPGSGPVGDGDSRGPSLSQNGDVVAFASRAGNFGYPGHVERVWRRRIGGGDTIAIASITSTTLVPIAGASPSMSDDGTRIAFTSDDAAVAEDTNAQPDVYVRDMVAETTRLASRATGTGAVGNAESYEPAIAGDGSLVAFTSAANQLDANDPDHRRDVYLRTLSGAPGAQVTTLVSVNPASGEKGLDSERPAVDDAGDRIAFLSRGTQLDLDDQSPGTDAYVKDLSANTIEVVSRADGPDGAVADGAQLADLSGDGTKAVVTLESPVNAPVFDPTLAQVWRRDLAAGATVPVSLPPVAAFVNAGGESGPRGAVSADGRRVAFRTTAPALLPALVPNGVVVRDRVSGATIFASRRDGPSGFPFLDEVGDVAISADGRRVAFSVTPRADEEQTQIHVRDLDTGRTFLASRADGAAGAAGDGASWGARLDADGSRVAFTTHAANLGDGDTDAAYDIHVRDLDTGRTLLASRADGAAGPKGNSTSYDHAISPDGTRVAFVSAATNLGDGDADGQYDTHLRDLAAGRTTLISATPGGVKANGPSSRDPSFDATGTKVTFQSYATNLPGNAGGGTKLWIRDLAAGTLEIASRADGPGGAPATAYFGALSADGRHVAFESEDPVLGVDPGPGHTLVYRRDLATGRTDLASRRTQLGTPGEGLFEVGGITADGGCVVFSGDDTLVGERIDSGQVYLRAFAGDCGAQPAAPVPAVPAPGAPRPAVPPLVRDRVAPVLRGARLSRRRFRVARAPTALSAATGRGTTLTFRASEAATLTLLLERRVPGRKVRRRCVAAPRRPQRGGCTAYRRTGTLTRRIRAGAGRVALSGRLGRRAMARGTYRLTLSARDAAGNRSRTVALTFTIVRR